MRSAAPVPLRSPCRHPAVPRGGAGRETSAGLRCRRDLSIGPWRRPRRRRTRGHGRVRSSWAVWVRAPRSMINVTCVSLWPRVSRVVRTSAVRCAWSRSSSAPVGLASGDSACAVTLPSSGVTVARSSGVRPCRAIGRAGGPAALVPTRGRGACPRWRGAMPSATSGRAVRAHPSCPHGAPRAPTPLRGHRAPARGTRPAPRTPWPMRASPVVRVLRPHDVRSRRGPPWTSPPPLLRSSTCSKHGVADPSRQVSSSAILRTCCRTNPR